MRENILVINLAREEDDVFRIIRFPDGQHSIELKYFENNPGEDPSTYDVEIKTRITSWEDIEILRCLVSVLNSYKVNLYNLRIMYLLGARSDRKFKVESEHYLKDVIAPEINSLGFNSVSVLHPHSDVTEACINNFKNDSNKTYFYNIVKKEIKEEFNLISPDAGALKNTLKFYNQYPDNIVDVSCAEKIRDVNGNITRTKFIKPDNDINTFVILDDLCDGGRTFIELAKVIKQNYSNEPFSTSCKIILIVTHGVFSKGFSKIKEHINEIYTTNSFADIDGIDNVNVIEVI